MFYDFDPELESNCNRALSKALSVEKLIMSSIHEKYFIRNTMFYDFDPELESNYKRALFKALSVEKLIMSSIYEKYDVSYEKYDVSTTNQLVDNAISLNFFCALGNPSDYDFQLKLNGFYDHLDGEVVDSIFIIRRELLEDLCNELTLLLKLNSYHLARVEKSNFRDNTVDIRVVLPEY